MNALGNRMNKGKVDRDKKITLEVGVTQMEGEDLPKDRQGQSPEDRYMVLLQGEEPEAVGVQGSTGEERSALRAGAGALPRLVAHRTMGNLRHTVCESKAIVFDTPLSSE
jgi:hypothetical protein